MRRGRSKRSWIRHAIYRAIERENIDLQLAKPAPIRPTVVVSLNAEDRRDPREIARAANAALRGAVA
jgi:hypothetical protein